MLRPAARLGLYVPHAGHTETLVGNDPVLLAGGSNGNRLASAELFNATAT
jgi:hypothetical protein